AFDFSNTYFFWDPSLDYGRENGVRRFAVNFNHVYELPFGKGHKFLASSSRAADYLVGGWQLSGVAFWGSGLPFTPSYTNFGSDADTGPNRPNLVGDASVSEPSAKAWFAPAPAGTGGESGAPTATTTQTFKTNRLQARPLESP